MFKNDCIKKTIEDTGTSPIHGLDSKFKSTTFVQDQDDLKVIHFRKMCHYKSSKLTKEWSADTFDWMGEMSSLDNVIGHTKKRICKMLSTVHVW